MVYCSIDFFVYLYTLNYNKFSSEKMLRYLICILGILNVTVSYCDASNATYMRDKNTDLTDVFKTDASPVSSTASCYLSCLVFCNNNASCIAVTYSTIDSTCNMYTIDPCYTNNTLARDNVDLYRKKASESKISVNVKIE
jgi:hypothetical protein